LIPLLIGMALIAFNLRPWVTSVGPVLPGMRDDLDMTSTLASVLTALPVACFALVSPLAPGLLRRFQMEPVVVASLVLVGAGLLLRVGPGVPAVLTGTIVAGAAIAILNVLLPVMVKRDAPERAGLLVGTYTMMISGGAALGAGVTVPFADAVGGGWRSGLALWVVPLIPAALYWVTRPRTANASFDALGGSPPAEAAPPARSLRWRVDWPVALFFGLQSGVFYAAVGWLPSVFHDQGFTTAEAGGLTSLALVVGIPTGLLAPIIATWQKDPQMGVAGFSLVAAAGLVGLFAAPGAAAAWMVLFGIGIGGTFPLGLMLIVTRSPTPRATERLSSAAQTLGYSLAIAAPIAVGELHSLTGSWTPALAVLAAVMVATMFAGLVAARGPSYGIAGKRPGG
jgi:MFS transporter, CP family, cyanate transporter